MTKYQTLIKKIYLWKRGPHACSNFSPQEIELITEALETIQFLEIIFKAKNQRNK